ncbi:MAG: CHAP domain-containing protein [Proteobacteria bacterium]|nr:MAG: CHAP domain-containing protein [Pseudomonadota bacterium]
MKKLILFSLMLFSCSSQTPLTAPASGSAGAQAPAEISLPAACTSSCVTPFGTALGSAQGVKAYSNCQPACVYEKPSMVGETYAGIEWQCVEFARRWLIHSRGVTFPSIDYAADLWRQVDHYSKVGSKEAVPVSNIENGSASSPPKTGDLLVYGREFLGTGHLAVVLAVDAKRKMIRVGEENFANKPWPAAYSREIPYAQREGKIWVLDAYLLGWKTIK